VPEARRQIVRTIVFQAAGALAFLVGTLVIGARIRRNPNKENAESLSRVSHLLFWGGLVLPELLGVLRPGLAAFDGLLGLPSLPPSVFIRASGWFLLAAGAYLVAASGLALRTKGEGYAAFRLTRRVVAQSVYEYVRNPMSLGMYCGYVGISVLAGSSYLLLGAVLVVIPAHVFNLLYFEQGELLARYGTSYADYMRRVPFILPLPHGGANGRP